MKKFLSILLLLAMCLGMLAACGGKKDDPADTTADTTLAGEEAATLEDAVEYLTSTYKTDEGKATPADYKLIAQIPIDDKTFTITWTVDLDSITITLSDGLYNVKVPAKNDEEKTYTLTATVADADGNTAQKTFTRVLPVYDNSAAVGADDIKENTPYKLYLVQVGVGKTLFATTETQSDNKYIKTDIDPKKGADFFAEKVDGGYKFYTEINGVKNYVHAKTTTAEDGKVSKYIGYATESDCVYYFKADCNAWFVKIDNIEYVVGTYSSYETICISEGTYMTPDTTGVTQFPVLIMDKDAAEVMTPSEEIKDPTELSTIPALLEIAGKLANQAQTAEKYLVEGKIVEIKNETYGNLYIEDASGNKLYVYGIYDKTGATRFDAMNPQPKVGDTVVLMGVLSMYNDEGQMKNGWVQKLNGADYVGSGSSGSTDTPAAPSGEPVIPEAGTAYKLYFIQKNKNNTAYYLTGVLSGYYMATSETGSEGADFFIEATEGGYYLYCTVDGAKKYVNVMKSEDGAHTNAKFEDAATSVWTIDETLKTVVTTLSDGSYILGTKADGTYTTLGPMLSDSGCMYAQFILPGDVPATPDTPDTPVVPAGDKTITEFNTIASAQPDKGDVTAEKYTVTGKITEIVNTQYGNMHIQDDAGNDLYIYGVYSADGKVRFDAMNPQPKVGDTIVITGVACNYNGPQMKNGWVQKLNGNDYVAEAPAEPDEPELPTGEAASIDFKDTANRTVGTTEQQVWVMNGITVTNNKGGATSNVNTKYNDPIRCYKGSDLEIAYTGMKKIVIVCNSADYASVLVANTPSAGSIAAEGAIVTITLDSAADKVSFSGLSAQVRIDKIQVYTA